MLKTDVTVYQGDDTHFMGQTNRWYLPDGDYTGYKARYSVGFIVKNAEIEQEIDEDGSIHKFVGLVLTAEDTATLEPGIYTAALKLYDVNGLCQTVSSTTIQILPQEVNNNGI